MVAPLRVRVFGNLQVEGVDFGALGSRKQRTLLRMLAAAGGEPVSVDRIAEGLWPDRLPSRPADQIGVLVSRLRSVLGAERIRRHDAGYALSADWIDVVAFEELAAEAWRRLREHQPAAAATAAQAGLDLAARPLLGDEPDAPWADEARREAERHVAALRSVAAEAWLAIGDPMAAASAAQAMLDRDPYDECALRLVMTAHTRAGRPGAALAAYAHTREVLAETLGTSPSALTEDLHGAILRDEIGAAPSAPSPPPALNALAGRERAWAILDQAYDRAGRGVEVVMVEGEPGMGKTRLLETWCASKTGGAVLRGEGDPVGTALPCQPLLDALERHLARADRPAAADLLSRAGPVLGPLLPGYDGPAVAQDPLTAQATLFRAVLEFCCRAAGERTAVLALDDVHLADASTRAWLGFAARRPEAGSLLVVATVRPESAFSVPEATAVVLEPLDLAAASQIVGPKRAPSLLERSGGNPFFLVQLASFSGPDLPESILEAVSARAAEAGEAESTLRIAAVLGPELDLDLLTGILHRSALDLLVHLETGQRLMILDERGLRFVFRHELVREALMAGTSAARRALVHREAAHLLAGRPLQDHLVIATHARQGGEVALAAQALVEGAADASARFDHAEAERLLTESLQLSPGAPAFLARGRVRLTTERFVEAAADADKAHELGARADGLELASWSAYYQRDFDRARRLCAEAQSILDTADDQLRPSILALAGRIAHADGRLALARETLQSAVATGGATGRTAVGKVWLGWLLTDQGDTGSAERLIDEAAADPALVTHPFARAHRSLLAAYAAGLGGQIATALAQLDAVDREVERRHLDHFAGRTANYRAWLLRNLLFESEADELNQLAAETARGRGLREAQVQAALDQADARLRRRELAEAADALGRADAVGTGFAFDWKARLRRALLDARLALAAGRFEEAVVRADDLGTAATRLGTPRYAVLARAVTAQAQAGGSKGTALRADPGLPAALSRHAAPEAWWITAELARDLRIDDWWPLAERMVAGLMQGAGPRGEAFARQAGRRLESTRSSRRSE